MKLNQLLFCVAGLSVGQILSDDCCLEGGFEGSFLYWSASEDQLGFAIPDTNIFTNSPSVSNAKLKTHHPEWDYGFRFAGFLNHNDVSYRLGWTYFCTESHESAFSMTDGFPSLGVPTVIAIFRDSPFLIAEGAKSTWKIDVNEFIFDIEYLACVCNSFSFYPKAGIFGAVVNQHQDLEYTGVPTGISEILGSTSLLKQNRASGLGPRIGVEVDWNIWSCFNVVGEFNFNYFIGQFNANNNINSSFPTGFDSIQESICRARPVITGSIGIAWNEPFGIAPGFYLSANYEFQHWFSFWHNCSNFLDDIFSGEGRWGDLQLHGLTITGGFSF